MRHCWGCWRGIGGGTGDPSREPGGAQRPRQQMWPTVECAVLRYGMVFLIWHGMIMVWLVLLDVSLHVWWSCKVAVWYDTCVQCTWTTLYMIARILLPCVASLTLFLVVVSWANMPQVQTPTTLPKLIHDQFFWRSIFVFLAFQRD